MLKPPLPRHAELRKLVASGGRLTGTVALAQLQRLGTVLLSSGGVVEVELRGTVDEEGFRLVTGSVRGSLQLECQRCLQPMRHDVDATFALALVWRDEEIAALPPSVDGLVVGTDPYDLYDLVEEELLLALPLAPRHEDACQVPGFEPEPDEHPEPAAPNPFSALAGFKRGSD